MGNDSHRETLIIVNPAAHNVPSRKRLDEADGWLRSQGWQVEWREKGGAARGGGGGGGGGARRRIDLGRAGDRYFLLMAGYGLDGAIARRVHLGLKSRLGAATYAIAAVREALRYRSSPVTLRFDGEERDAEVLMLVAGNTRNYAGLVEITREAQADDGLLDVCVYEGKGTVDIVLHALRSLLRRHLRSKKVTYRKVKRLEFARGEPLPVQLDGDEFEDSPALVEIAAGAPLGAVPKGGSF